MIIDGQLNYFWHFCWIRPFETWFGCIIRIRIIGKWISFMEKVLRRIFPGGRSGERMAGAVLLCDGCPSGLFNS